MSILGIDYGGKRIGVAISYWGTKAQPIGTFSGKEVWQKLPEWIKSFNLEKIILGLPSGKMTGRVKAFGKRVNYTYNIIKVEYQDETLTSHEAKILLARSGVAKEKRHKLLDAYAACLILDEYLKGSDNDNNL